MTNGTGHHANGHQRKGAVNPRPVRHRFIVSPKAAGQAPAPIASGRGRPPKATIASPVKGLPQGKHLPPGKPGSHGKMPPAKNGDSTKPAGPAIPGQAVDLTETIKTLLHLAHEHGHVTYDDINDILPDGLSPEDLDELYTKLRGLDVEIVDHAEVERAKPAEPRRLRKTRASKFWMIPSGCT